MVIPPLTQEQIDLNTSVESNDGTASTWTREVPRTAAVHTLSRPGTIEDPVVEKPAAIA